MTLLDFVVALALPVIVAYVVGYARGYFDGRRAGVDAFKAAAKQAAQDWARDNADDLALGQELRDLVRRHHLAVITTGEGCTVRHSGTIEHAGRHYTLVMTSPEEGCDNG